MKKLEDKKKELERLQREIEDEESRIQFEKEKTNAKSNNLCIPLATAVVKYNLYNKSERDFEEMGDSGWYRVHELLGSPDFKKNTKVVLLNTGDNAAWFTERGSGDYYGIDDDEFGLDNSEKNREYLINIDVR